MGQLQVPTVLGSQGCPLRDPAILDPIQSQFWKLRTGALHPPSLLFLCPVNQTLLLLHTCKGRSPPLGYQIEAERRAWSLGIGSEMNPSSAFPPSRLLCRDPKGNDIVTPGPQHCLGVLENPAAEEIKYLTVSLAAALRANGMLGPHKKGVSHIIQSKSLFQELKFVKIVSNSPSFYYKEGYCDTLKPSKREKSPQGHEHARLGEIQPAL